MAHHRDGDESFVRLSTQLIDVHSKQTSADIVVPPSQNQELLWPLKKFLAEWEDATARTKEGCAISMGAIFFTEDGTSTLGSCAIVHGKEELACASGQKGVADFRTTQAFSARVKRDEDF